MKRIVQLTEINEFLDRVGSERVVKVNTWLDKLTFPRILLLWVFLIVLFGLIYHFLSGKDTHLMYNTTKTAVDNILDQIYFSFITATTTGFGDIVPVGYFKVLAIFEVISGWLLLAFVTSKLVSIKQDVILNEIYEISFNERINRLRSSLLVFRQNIGRIMNKVEEGLIRRREVNDIYVYISSLEDCLNEALILIGRSGKNHFTKAVDPMNTELIFNSVLQSFEKLNEFINLLNHSRLEWKRDITINLINRCISKNILLFEKLNPKILSEKIVLDLNSRKSKLIEDIKGKLNANNEEQKDIKTKNL